MFAGSVMLGDLDDFISPSQACVNPLFTDTKTKKNSTNLSDTNKSINDGIAKLNLLSDLGSSLVYDTTIKPNLIKNVPLSSTTTNDGSVSSSSNNTNTTARVTLNDCLACSGCVTSAETVLIQQQSIEEMFKAINNPAYDIIIVSISPQALASIAAHYQITSLVETFERLSTYLYSIGVHAVLDTQVALDCALVEEIHEFIRKLQTLYISSSSPSNPHNNNTPSTTKGKTLQWDVPDYSVGVSATRIRPFQSATASSSASSSSSYVAPLFASSSAPKPLDIITAPIPGFPESSPTSINTPSTSSQQQQLLPQLTSSCPGWVCYAEKTVPEILPYISTLKSAQQILGTLIKLLPSQGQISIPRYTKSNSTNIDPSRIFHVTIMPCYDKKLEGSRRDFYWENDSLVTTLVPFASTTTTNNNKSNNTDANEEQGIKEVDCVITALEIVDLLTNGINLNYKLINKITNDEIIIPKNVDLLTIPRTSRHGLLYSTGSTDTTIPPNIEEIFCSINKDTQVFSGGIPSHNESDGYCSYLIKYLGTVLQGQLQRSNTSSTRTSASMNTSNNGNTNLLNPEENSALLSNLELSLPFTPSRNNNDMKELILNISYKALQNYQFSFNQTNSSIITSDNTNDIQIPLVFATAYGFRNIQGIINKLKRSRNNTSVLTSSTTTDISIPAPPPYAYVEIMACPQGCINGGGLVKVDIESARQQKDADRGINNINTVDITNSPLPSTTTSSSLKALADAQKQRVQQVSTLVHSNQRSSTNKTPFDTVNKLLSTIPLLSQIYQYKESTTTTQTSIPWRYIFHTRYHAIPPLETNVVKW